MAKNYYTITTSSDDNTGSIVQSSTSTKQNNASKKMTAPRITYPCNVEKQVLMYRKLVIPFGMRSIYWKYYGFPGNAENEILTKEKVICSLCKSAMSYNGNTSNLRMHLQNKHNEHLINLEATTPRKTAKTAQEKLAHRKNSRDNNVPPRTIEVDGVVEIANGPLDTLHKPEYRVYTVNEGDNSSTSSAINYLSDSMIENVSSYLVPEESSAHEQDDNSKSLTEAILHFIVADLQTFDLVEGYGLQLLVTKLSSSSSLLPTVSDLEEQLPLHYLSIQEGVVAEIVSSADISLSIEEWIGINDKTFFTFAVHFINEHSLETRILSTVQSYPGIEWPETLESILFPWGIRTGRLTGIISGTNDEKLLKAIGRWATTVPCLLWSLQVSAMACFNVTVVSDLVQKCRDIAFCLTNQAIQEQDPAIVKLTADNPSHWISTYEMLLRFSENEVQLKTLEGFNKPLNEDDWRSLKDIIAVLEPFKITVQTLQEEVPPLLSIVKPLLWQLVTTYLQIKDEDSELVQMIKNLLKTRLSTGYNSSKTTVLLQTTTTLDPRFKQLSYATDEEKLTVQQEIKLALSNLVSECVESTSSNQLQTSSPNKKRLSGMEMLLGDLCVTKQGIAPSDRAELEWVQYTSEPAILFDENPLVWWNVTESKSPNLARLAKKYTCLPACAIPPSRVPLDKKEIFDRRRAAISAELVDKMLFLNGNMVH